MDMIILGVILFFFLWPTYVDINDGGRVASGLLPLFNIRTSRTTRGQRRKDKKKRNEKKTTVKPSTEAESSSEGKTATTTMVTTDITESEAEKLEMMEAMVPRMEMMEDPACQPHTSALISRFFIFFL